MKFLSNINIANNKILAVDLVEFNENIADVTPGERQIIWNLEEGTFDIGLPGGVTGQMFEELYFKVKAVGDIADGDVVIFAGSTGSELLATKAINTTSLQPEFIMGVATQTIPNEGYGKITAFGRVRDINTLVFNQTENINQTILYISPYVSGQLTNEKPNAPYIKSSIAAVTKWDQSSGQIFVRPNLGSRLNDLHDVNISDSNSQQLLVYNHQTST